MGNGPSCMTDLQLLSIMCCHALKNGLRATSMALKACYKCLPIGSLFSLVIAWEVL